MNAKIDIEQLEDPDQIESTDLHNKLNTENKFQQNTQKQSAADVPIDLTLPTLTLPQVSTFKKETIQPVIDGAKSGNSSIREGEESNKNNQRRASNVLR